MAGWSERRNNQNRIAAEFLGTGFLVATVIGSGIMASRLTNDVGIQLLANSIATGAVLIALISTFQAVSASFNPVVSLVSAVEGSSRWNEVGPIITAQLSGGIAGAVLANLMFDLPAIEISTNGRHGPGLFLAEVIATAGLVMVIFGSVRAGRSESLPVVVGAYITAAYWFTSSTSFANPAVTVARTLSDTFAGIAPADAPWFLLAQACGGAIGLLAVRTTFPANQPQDRILT